MKEFITFYLNLISVSNPLQDLVKDSTHKALRNISQIKFHKIFLFNRTKSTFLSFLFILNLKMSDSDFKADEDLYDNPRLYKG